MQLNLITGAILNEIQPDTGITCVTDGMPLCAKQVAIYIIIFLFVHVC